MMKKEEKSIILKKLFNYDCSGEELKQLLEKLDSKEEKDFLFAEAERLWEESKENENRISVDSEKIYARVLTQMQQGENSSKITAQSNQLSLRSIARNPKVRNFLKIAAVLLIAALLFVGGYSVLHRSHQNTFAFIQVKVPRGAKKMVVLPDSTRVWINSESTFQYPKHFGGKTRTVHLTGEAYFEVTKDASHPFIVSTPEMNVKVLGTGFDVSAYPEAKHVSATLVHGRIMAYHVNTNGYIENKVVLSPGERSIFKPEKGAFTVKKVDTKIYTSWKEGDLVFKDTPFSEVVKRINRWYNVDMVVNDKTIEHFDYTVNFENDSLQSVLKVLEEITPVRFTISGNRIFVTRDKKRWNDFINVKK